jgi:hypothetical protein
MGVLAIGGWLVAAALAVGISWSAIGVVQQSVGAGQPAATALPAPSESAPVASPSSTRPTAAPTAGGPVVKAGDGGTVTAQCVNGRPRVVNAVPRQGFRVESDDSGAEVQFRSSDHRTEMTVSCSGLTATVRVEEHASGGGGGGGGDDNGGGGSGGGSGSRSGRGGGDG